tara:strand:- start:239 stop:424 length:186 start_codon:yes stop_codon:yes gene_type:complete
VRRYGVAFFMMIYSGYTHPISDDKFALILVFEGFNSADEANWFMDEVMAAYVDDDENATRH